MDETNERVGVKSKTLIGPVKEASGIAPQPQIYSGIRSYVCGFGDFAHNARVYSVLAASLTVYTYGMR